MRLWVVLGVILLLVAALVTYTEQTVTYATGVDEGYYLAYAIAIAHQGLTALPYLFAGHLASLEHTQLFPPPLRLTVMLCDAVAVRLFGAHAQSLQIVSLLPFLALLVINCGFLARFQGERTALWTTLLLAVSPLHLAMARRALSDSLVATLIVVSLWLLLAALSSPYRAARWWGVAASYCATFLAKEGTVVLVPLSWLVMLWYARRERAQVQWWPVCAVSLVPMAGAVVAVTWAAGGVLPAWQVLWSDVRSPAINAYALQYGSGPWFRYLIDWLLLSPWTTVLFLLWLGYLAGARHACAANEDSGAARQAGRADAAVWVWAFVPIYFIACGALFTKNVRYVLAMEMPLRLGAALFLQRLVRDRAGNPWATVRMLMCVVVLMAIDLISFAQLFVIADIYDPVSFPLLQERHLIPH